MSLNEFTALGRIAGSSCWYSKLGLAEDDQAALDEALAADPEEVTSVMIQRWLHLHDVSVTRPNVGRHRRGDCKCPRS